MNNKQIKEQYSSLTLELMTIKGETVAILNTSDKNRVFDFEKTITTNDVNTISFKMKFTNKYITSNSCENHSIKFLKSRLFNCINDLLPQFLRTYIRIILKSFLY